MVDIHTHVIPFVDDGSDSLEKSLDMIRHEISIGVTKIICTPHHIYGRYIKSVETIKENFDLLVNKVKEENLNIELVLGQEIYYSRRENIISMLDNKQLLTLGDTNYVLVEFSFTEEPDDIYEIIYNFECHHYKVIIAHVERYEWMTLDKIIGLRQEGALIQINANAIIGQTTRKQQKFVKKLIKKDLVDFIASDTHSFRPSNLDKAIAKTDAKYVLDKIK